MINNTEFHSIGDLVSTHKYGTLTSCYNDAVRRAEGANAGLVFLNADMVYSDGTFASLFKLINGGMRCVEIEGFRVNKRAVEEALRNACVNDADDRVAIRSRDLVNLALRHIHPISLAHFWEPETELGFIPFHTYWRVGGRGILAKASHIYPLYLYPRVWDAASERSIDWDLVDRTCPDPNERYIVCDSDEIFSCELSDVDYCIPATFPQGGTIAKMREFVAEHCSEQHRARLKCTIALHSDSTKHPLWYWASLKAFFWYRAVCEDSDFLAMMLWLIGLPHRAAYVARKVSRFLGFIQIGRQGGEDRQGLRFSQRTGRDPAPYVRLLDTVPGALDEHFKRVERSWLVRERLLIELDKRYEAICSGAESPLDFEERVDLAFRRQSFYGIGWRCPSGECWLPYRNLGPDGTAAIFVRLRPGRAYRARVEMFSMSHHLHSDLSLEANGKRVPQQGVELENHQWHASGAIPATVLVESNGFLKLSLTLANPKRRSSEFASVSRIVIQPFRSVQEAVLEQHGLCPMLYAWYAAVDEHYKQIYVACSPEAEFDASRAQAWIEGLDRSLAIDVVPKAISPVNDAGIMLAANILGVGWGRPGKWGEQSYRWLRPERTATLFLKLKPGKSYVLKTYIYTCPPEHLERFRVRINKNEALAQGLCWETDRFYYWCRVPAQTIADGDGIIEVSYFSESHNGRSVGGTALSRVVVEACPVAEGGASDPTRLTVPPFQLSGWNMQRDLLQRGRRKLLRLLKLR